MCNGKKTLYERLGGYDAITAVANDLLPASVPIHNSAASGHIVGGRRESREAAPDRLPLRQRGRSDVRSG